MKFNYFWRQVETGDANKIEFIRGGEKFLLVLGWLHILVMCIFSVWAIFEWIPLVQNQISYSLRLNDYRRAGFWYFVGGLPMTIILERLMLGVWLVFGRVSIIIDKTSGRITKDYRVRSFSLYTRSYQTGTLSSISFHRIGDVRRILLLSALYLHQKNDTPRKLLLAPKKYQKEGRAMAGQIADFLGIPGPAD